MGEGKKAGAGSRGTSRGADGRSERTLISAANFNADDLADTTVPRAAYDAIAANPGAATAYAMRDGSIYIRIPGYGKLDKGTAPKEVMDRIAKSAPNAPAGFMTRDASGKLVKQPKEGVIIR